LAGVRISLENILTRQLDLFFRNPVKEHQNNHPRDPNPKANRPHRILPFIILTQLAPPLKIESSKIIPCPIAFHHLRMPHVEQAEGPPNRADVYRLPKAIQDQNSLRGG
jgi:hypothetical protein